MSADKPKPVLMVTGVTACGKTSRAVTLARALGGEIVSADSRQVYRGMDIGTGKDLGEYGDVPVHVLDVVPAGYRYNLYEYLRDARACIDDIEFRGHLTIVCGGTGLYVESLARGTRLPEVPENPDLRKSLEGKSLAELTEILAGMKRLHNTTDVDTAKRAIRAIEIETYYAEHPELAAAVKGNGDDRRYPVKVVLVSHRIQGKLNRCFKMKRGRSGFIDKRLIRWGSRADTGVFLRTAGATRFQYRVEGHMNTLTVRIRKAGLQRIQDLAAAAAVGRRKLICHRADPGGIHFGDGAQDDLDKAVAHGGQTEAAKGRFHCLFHIGSPFRCF